MVHSNMPNISTIEKPGGGAVVSLLRENAELRERLSKFKEASLLIAQSLDLNTVLQNFIQGACTLTGARRGAIATLDEEGNTQDLISFGIPLEIRLQWANVPKMREFMSHLISLDSPLRMADFPSYAKSLGVPNGQLSASSFLSMPVLYHGLRVGSIFLSGKEDGLDFTSADEETLHTFASHAAAAIANARRYAEERRAKADLEALINISPVGVLVFDAKTSALVSANREVRRMVESLQLPDHTIEVVLADLTVRRADGRELTLKELPLSGAMKSGETIRAEEISISLADGRSIAALINAAPILSESGELVSVIVTLQDMTPLEDLERLRAQFLGVIGNELRTPMSTIKGSVSALLNPVSLLDPSESRQFLRIIDQQTDLMRTQINSLIELTRIQAGILAVQPRSVSIDTIVDEAKARLQMGQSTVAVEDRIDVGLPQVMADPERMGQVLHNLVTYAINFSPGTSRVRIAATKEDYSVAVTVSSDGREIRGAGLSHLFQRFSNSDPDHYQQRFGGEGLELAICKGIVEAHGGRIWGGLGSGGHGLTFTFTVPVADEIPGEVVPHAESSGSGVGGALTERVRVLVAVDDPRVLMFARSSLSRAGYTPFISFGLEDIDRLLEEEAPHVLLLDLSTSGSRGFELMRRVTEAHGVPTIVLSGQESDDHIVRAFEAGASDYIVKPFSPSELVARIKASLRKRAAANREGATPAFKLGALNIDRETRTVSIGAKPVQLTPTEFNVLDALASSAGRVVTREELLHRVWGSEYVHEVQILRTYVKTLRHKLGDSVRTPKYIFTEHGVGYRMPKP